MHCQWSPNSKMVITVTATVIITIIIIIWCILPYDYSHIQRTTHCDTNTENREKYLLFPMFTIKSGSGLGNQLFEIFALLGTAQTLNRTAIFNKKDWFLNFRLRNVRRKIPKIAEQVASMDIEPSESVRYINSPACCEYNFPHMLSCEQSKFLVIEGSFFQSYKYFSTMESIIHEWLTPYGDELDEVERMIAQQDFEKHKICVHIRRGDFVTDGHHAGTEKEFTSKAINYLYKLTPGSIFIFSNEQKWVQKEIVDLSNFKDDMKIMPTPANKPFKDLYFSKFFCDTVLITAPSSTFGWWLGYLSRNQTSVYYRDIREVDDPVKYEMIEDDFYPLQWNKLGLDHNGTIVLKRQQPTQDLLNR